MGSKAGLEFLSPLSRLLLSFVFLVAGLSKFFGWDSTAAYMVSKGMPFASQLLALAIIVELLGGLALLFGFRTRAAAGVLFLYLIPVTFVFHGFWAYQGIELQSQLINFLKNLAIMGGLLAFVVHGAGALSLDARRKRRGEPPGRAGAREHELRHAG